MRLIVESADNRVAVIDPLEPLLEYGTLAVRLDVVSTLLDAIRVGANAVTPVDSAILEANPSRMAMLAQTIMGVSAAAKALAEGRLAADPTDADARTIMGALGQLHL